jgi:D-aspartate ligase
MIKTGRANGHETNSVALVMEMGQNGLGVARSLGREGISVIGMDFSSEAPGLRSTYCNPVLGPHPIKHPEQVLSILLNVGKRLGEKGVLYPAADEYVLFTSRHRRELAEYFRLAIPPEKVVESILNKRTQYMLAKEAGVNYPNTYFPESPSDVEKIKDEIKYPVIIKPYYPHLWIPRFGNKGFSVSNPQELVRRYTDVFAAHLQAMIQSIVPGPHVNLILVSTYVTKQGRPIVSFASRKIRQHPTDFGIGTCIESIHDKKAVQLGLDFLESIGYRGIGELEFKKDARDGEYKLIELNARIWTYNILATCAGINFPLIQYLDLTDQPIAIPNDYQDSMQWLNATLDLLAFRELNHARKLTFLSWMKSIWNTDCHAYFAWDDLKPFVRQYQNNLSQLPNYLHNRRMILA